MADTNQQDTTPSTVQPRQENAINGFLATNHKPPHLQEVEDDAVYIQTKRFEEHYTELEREKEKKAMAEARAKKGTN